MDNYTIIEDDRIEYYRVKTEIKENYGVVHNTYNFRDTNNLVDFISQFLKSNGTSVSKDLILEELEATDTYRFIDKEFKIKCSLYLMNFEG